MHSAAIIARLTRLLGVVLLLPFLALTLIPAHVMPARGADGTLTMVLCVNGGAQTVTVDLATGKPVERMPATAAGHCDWACGHMAVADLAQPALTALVIRARHASVPVPPAMLANASATGLPPATGPPALT